MKGKGLSDEAVFTVLNPEGLKPEREIHPLSPRLDTLEGKTVNVISLYRGPATKGIMETIARDLKAAVPGCNVVCFTTEGGAGSGPLTEEDWAKILDCDAAILGHNF